MNVNLIIVVITIFIFKNNSRQYWYAKNKNQNLLLFLLFINEMNLCLNNRYNYINLINNRNRYYINYFNQALAGINDIENTINDTYIDKIEDIMINNDTVDPISSNTDNDNDNDYNTIVNNKDNRIKSKENIPKNAEKNTIISEDNSTIDTTNSDSTKLENKFIEPTTKIHDKSSTYKDQFQMNNNISISNTFKQLSSAQMDANISEYSRSFNLEIATPFTDVKANLPVLVGSTNITELFYGKVTFPNPIISISNVNNEIFITSKSIIPTLHTNANNAELHYEGFLKTQLGYLKDVIIENHEIECDSKYYIMLIPFSGSRELNFADEIINSPNIVLSDFDLDINKSTFSIDTCLEEPVKGNEYINLYKICNLTVKVDCDVSLYRKKLVQL